MLPLRETVKKQTLSTMKGAFLCYAFICESLAVFIEDLLEN